MNTNLSADQVAELLKSLLTYYPEQRVDWKNPEYVIFIGHWDDVHCNDECSVNSMYINENNELSFDLTKHTYCNGDYLGSKELKNITFDFIANETDEWHEGDDLGILEYLKKGLKSVVVPSSVTSILEESFSASTRLQEVVISDGVTEIGPSAFKNCRKLLKVVIPSSVKSIKKEAFSGCKSLQEIVIPNGVTSILAHAFKGCSSLEIVRLPVEVSNMEISAFADCPKLKAIYVPKGKVDFYKERFPSDMHWLIVEEGIDLPDKADNFIAKDLLFAPSLRMVVPKNEADSDILSAAKKHLDKLSKTEIIEWVIEHLDSITDSQKPYEGV
jgi:hypothetical protein